MIISETTEEVRAFRERESKRFKIWWYSFAGHAYRERVRERRNEQHKKYRQSDKGKVVQARKAEKMRKKYPEKHMARSLLHFSNCTILSVIILNILLRLIPFLRD